MSRKWLVSLNILLSHIYTFGLLYWLTLRYGNETLLPKDFLNATIFILRVTCLGEILETFRTSMIPGCKKKRTENSEQCYSHRSINMPEVRGGFFLWNSSSLPLLSTRQKAYQKFSHFRFFLVQSSCYFSPGTHETQQRA